MYVPGGHNVTQYNIKTGTTESMCANIQHTTAGSKNNDFSQNSSYAAYNAYIYIYIYMRTAHGLQSRRMRGQITNMRILYTWYGHMRVHTHACMLTRMRTSTHSHTHICTHAHSVSMHRHLFHVQGPYTWSTNSLHSKTYLLTLV